MDKSNSGSSDQPLNCTTPKFDDKIQYLLSAEVLGSPPMRTTPAS